MLKNNSLKIWIIGKKILGLCKIKNIMKKITTILVMFVLLLTSCEKEETLERPTLKVIATTNINEDFSVQTGSTFSITVRAYQNPMGDKELVELTTIIGKDSLTFYHVSTNTHTETFTFDAPNQNQVLRYGIGVINNKGESAYQSFYIVGTN